MNSNFQGAPLPVGNPNRKIAQDYINELEAINRVYLENRNAQQAPQEDYSDVIAQRQAWLANKQPVAPRSDMNARDWNYFNNAAKEAREINTGLTHLWTHKGEIADEILGNISDYYTGKTPLEAVLGTGRQVLKVPEFIVNAVGDAYNFNTKDIGEKSVRDIAMGAVQGAYENPVSFWLDALSLGGAGAIGKSIKNTKWGGKLVKPAEVEKAIAGERVAVTRDVEKIRTTYDNLKKASSGNNALLAEAIRGAETGAEVTAEAKPLMKPLKQLSKEYDEFTKKYPVNAANMPEGKEIATIQKILRDRLGAGVDTTYEQVRREVTAIKQSGEELDELIKAGNTLAKEVQNAEKLYDAGRIFPVTHALANIEKTTATIDNSISGLSDATRAGIFGNRLWGTSSYEDIAKQLHNPNDLLDILSNRYANNAIAQGLLRGELGGMDLVKDASLSKNLRYLDRGTLETGDARKAIREMRDKRMLETDIALDANTAEELLKQAAGGTGRALGDAMQSGYNISKGVMMASGGYLGPNAITGASNLLMNSGANTLDDIIAATRTGGKLAKDAGVYRYDVSPIMAKTPILRGIQKFNFHTGGKVFSKIDKAMQNRFAEVALNANLRKRGIPLEQRAEFLRNATKKTLGEIIQDTNRVALISTTNIGPLPKGFMDAIGVVAPFWRWNVTATQSTARMLEKSPFIANVVLNDILANIGFDREMQNRMRLGVTLDKPYVSFKIDPKTGQMRQMTAEFVPQTTSFRTFDFGNQGEFPLAIPTFTALINASQGKDKYGNPLKRSKTIDGIVTDIVGTKRMQYDPNTNSFNELKGGKGDEIAIAILNELFAQPKLVNRTIGPATASIFGEGDKFYQPYGNNIFGTFTTNENINNILFGGNPLRGRSLGDVAKQFGGVYETPYFESEDRGVTPKEQRQFFRRQNRLDQRKFWRDRY